MNNWISVKDRLPESKANIVLIAYKNGDVRQAHYEKPNEPEPWYDFYNEGWVNTRTITHWMPLPEPPKE